MELKEILIFVMALFTILSLFKKKKEYPEWRKKEAELYFNGSLGNGNPYDSGPRTHGLALSVKDGKARFHKQSKKIL